MDTPTDGRKSTPVPRGRRPNPQRRAETRRKLIDAALASLAESGFAATTTTEVVERSGLSRGALFAHFATRDALMAAVAEQAVSDLTILYESTFVTAVSAGEEPPAVVAIGCINEVAQTSTMLAVSLLFAEAATSPTLREVLRPVAEANFDELLERARVVLPELDHDEPTRQAFLVMWFALLGMAFQKAVFLAPGVEQTVLSGLTGFARAAFSPTTEPPPEPSPSKEPAG